MGLGLGVGVGVGVGLFAVQHLGSVAAVAEEQVVERELAELVHGDGVRAAERESVVLKGAGGARLGSEPHVLAQLTVEDVLRRPEHREARERQHLHLRDTREMDGRCAGDAREVRGRYARGMWEVCLWHMWLEWRRREPAQHHQRSGAAGTSAAPPAQLDAPPRRPERGSRAAGRPRVRQ